MVDVDIAVERLIPIPGKSTVVVGTVVAGEVHGGDVFEFRVSPLGARASRSGEGSSLRPVRAIASGCSSTATSRRRNSGRPGGAHGYQAYDPP